MDTVLNIRINALRDSLEDEVHGLWISNEMAIKILAAVDVATRRAIAGEANLGLPPIPAVATKTTA